MSVEDRLSALENKVSECSAKIQVMLESNNQMTMILKYVVVPLITLVGAIFGLKELIPTP